MSLRAKGEICEVEATGTFISYFSSVGGSDEDRLQGEHLQQVWTLLLSVAFSTILNLFHRMPGCQRGVGADER